MSNLTVREGWFFFSGLLWGMSTVFALLTISWVVGSIQGWSLTRGDAISFAFFGVVFAGLAAYGWTRATDEYVSTSEAALDDDVDGGQP